MDKKKQIAWFRNPQHPYIVDLTYRLPDGTKTSIRYTTGDLQNFQSFISGHKDFSNWLWMNVFFRYIQVEEQFSRLGFFEDVDEDESIRKKYGQIASYTKNLPPTSIHPTIKEIERYCEKCRHSYSYFEKAKKETNIYKLVMNF